MGKMRLILSPIVATALAVAPVSAGAMERTPAPLEDSEELGRSPILTIVLIAALLGALILVVSDSDNPVSP
jgi:hypothetical protein